ncbi:MAG: amidohydrolase family protein [Patescibacteria group bacterium]
MASASYLLKGGTIIDGSGFPMYKGDIVIAGETIKAVGPTRYSTANRIIDVSGKYIMPGGIDITNHSDTHWTLFTAPSQESMLQQGITTIIGGACGSSLAPLPNINAIRGIQKWVDVSTINVNWRSQEEFFTELSKHGLGVNFGTFVGHGTLRRGVVGDESRQLTKEELDSMKLLLRRSLDEGAMGLSIGLATSHGSFVPQEELIELAKVVRDTGKIISIHMRNEGRKILTSVVEVINIARSSNADVQIAHMKAIGRKGWEDMKKALQIIRKARKAENLSIWVDFFPYLRTGSLLYTLLPEWLREGGKEKILETLTNKERRREVIEGITSLTLHYDHMTIAEAQKDKKSVGKTIAQLAQESGLQPEEVIVEILIVNGLGVTIFGKTLNGKNIAMIAKEDYSMLGSDGVGEGSETKLRKGDLTHPRSYGALPRFLNRAVTYGNLLSWEDAIKKCTSIPAARLGMQDSRGTLKKGYFADVVVFSPEDIKDTATYSSPYQRPKGIDYVFVNGRLTIEKGTFTGALAGKILRRG